MRRKGGRLTCTPPLNPSPFAKRANSNVEGGMVQGARLYLLCGDMSCYILLISRARPTKNPAKSIYMVVKPMQIISMGKHQGSTQDSVDLL